MTTTPQTKETRTFYTKEILNQFRLKKSRLSFFQTGIVIQIIEHLINKGESTVTDIEYKIGKSHSSCCQALNRLYREGVVRKNRSGKFIYYSINKPVLEYVIKRDLLIMDNV